MVQQQDVLAVCCYLKGYNISMSPDNEWLQQCIDYFKTENSECTRTELQEFVCQQWLLADLRVIQNGCFPPNCENERFTLLAGKYSVQVNWVRDIGKSSYSQLRNITDDQSRHNELDIEESVEEKTFRTASTQTLMLEMTDGITALKGMEYRPIKKFTVPILPGTKMIITGPVECRRGVLLLQEDNVTILGGEVDSLLEVNSPANVLARSLNLPENGVGNMYTSYITGTAENRQPASPVNNRHRNNAVPIHSRHTAVAPPSNIYRDTTPLSPPASSMPNDVSTNFDQDFDEDDELLLQVPEEVLNATADEGQVEIQLSRNSGQQNNSAVSEEVEEVYSDESDGEVFLDNPMISQQIRRNSSQFNRSSVKCTTQTQIAANNQSVNTVHRTSVTSQNVINRQNINITKPPTKPQIPVNNRLSLSSTLSTPTNSGRHSMAGTSFMSGTPGTSFQNSTPGTSFQSSSLLFSNTESKKQNPFSKDQSEKAKYTVSDSSTVEKKSVHENIVNDIDSIEIEDSDGAPDSKVTEEIFGSVQRLSSKLRIVQSEWVLTACISDGSKTYDVKFSSQVVDELIGFSAAELEARRFETANNPAVKEKVNNMLKNGQKQLSSLSCAMLLEHSKDSDMPTVIKIMK